jgi:hypothetical protein
MERSGQFQAVDISGEEMDMFVKKFHRPITGHTRGVEFTAGLHMRSLATT